MSADKYPSIFSSQMKAIVFITRDIDMMCYSFKIEEPAVQELSQQIDKY